jgi:hypothetical protein
MSWKMYRWVWELRSPLHIGDTPAGSLNRTRLYVPARALWGALTAELARRRSPNFPDYGSVGQCLQKNTRLSYLFPAEQVGGEWKAWLPRYQKGKGLVWVREDDERNAWPERFFRQRLLSARPSTAIEPTSDSAEEGTLRELEVINPYWRDKDATPEPKPVAMVGYLFCKNQKLKDDLEAVREIFVGGETRYGLGRLVRVDLREVRSFFGRTSVAPEKEADPEKTDEKTELVFEASWALAHIPAVSLPDGQGAMEYIAGWDMVKDSLKEGTLAWVPGSCWQANREFIIQEEGLWQVKGA